MPNYSFVHPQSEFPTFGTQGPYLVTQQPNLNLRTLRTQPKPYLRDRDTLLREPDLGPRNSAGGQSTQPKDQVKPNAWCPNSVILSPQKTWLTIDVAVFFVIVAGFACFKKEVDKVQYLDIGCTLSVASR